MFPGVPRVCCSMQTRAEHFGDITATIFTGCSPRSEGCAAGCWWGCRMSLRPIPLLCHLPGPPALPPPPSWLPATSSWGFVHLPQYLDVPNCPKCETTLFFFFYNPNTGLKKQLVSSLFLLRVFKIIPFRGQEEESH